ncbi:hypothetical protein, partial [Lentimicrobium sp. S6]|uniref:hypothetical protein n=1 Tax=Lentimicrobium sp. S6 TaxID=2735872 RepID=UPI0015517C8F
YSANLGAELSTDGTYYYATRFQYLEQDMVYGGFNGGFYDGTTNLNGELTVTTPVVDDEITWANLQHPESGAIAPNEEFLVYGRLYIENVTEVAGEDTDIQAWIGYSTDNTNPNTWTNWVAASYLGEVADSDNDEYSANLGAELSTDGTYYYATRFQYLEQDMVYGGFNGGFYDGTTNLNGELTVTTPT